MVNFVKRCNGCSFFLRSTIILFTFKILIYDFRQGRTEQAYHLLSREGPATPSARFLLARCCADLRRDAEAEAVLRGTLMDTRKEVQTEEVTSAFGDKAAFALQLLSKLYRRSERAKKGVRTLIYF